MSDLRYPIGRHERVATLAPAQRHECIEQIAAAPAQLRRAVAGLDDRQLDTPYRPDGWTVRQVVHHVPDSHMTGYSRIKFALTQDNPVVIAYDEDAWAKLGDYSRITAIETSLNLLDAIHDRWVTLLRSLTPEQFARPMQHSENGRMTVDTVVANYAWHGPHHIAHITSLRKRMGW